MTKVVDFSALVHELLVRDMDVATFMRELIDAHARAYPEHDWTELAHIDFDEQDALLERWLVPCFKREPPRNKRIKAIWCGIFNPIRDGEARADMYVAGTTRFEMNEMPPEWHVGAAYRPLLRYATSRVLKEIHRRASNGPGENFLCVGYAAKTMAALLERVDADCVLGKRDEVHVAVGWDSGDPLYIGRLTRDGFVPTPLETALAGLREEARRAEAYHRRLERERERTRPAFRNFRHADGRRWSIAVGDDSIELAFTDADGDEHRRTRRRETNESMAAVADALVTEQIREGFVEAK